MHACTCPRALHLCFVRCALLATAAAQRNIRAALGLVHSSLSTAPVQGGSSDEEAARWSSAVSIRSGWSPTATLAAREPFVRLGCPTGQGTLIGHGALTEDRATSAVLVALSVELPGTRASYGETESSRRAGDGAWPVGPVTWGSRCAISRQWRRISNGASWFASGSAHRAVWYLPHERGCNVAAVV